MYCTLPAYPALYFGLLHNGGIASLPLSRSYSGTHRTIFSEHLRQVVSDAAALPSQPGSIVVSSLVTIFSTRPHCTIPLSFKSTSHIQWYTSAFVLLGTIPNIQFQTSVSELGINTPLWTVNRAFFNIIWLLVIVYLLSQ